MIGLALFGVNRYVSVTVISILVAIYTLVGGLRAVVVTESIQAIVLVVGALVNKLLNHNRLLLDKFFITFGINPNLTKNQKYVKELIGYGTIAA